MHWFSLLSVITSATISLANLIAPRWDDMTVKHSWDSIPDKWEHHGHPPDGATINLRIALKPHRDNALIDALYEVSDPKHPKYGAHLSGEQVAELVAAHPETIDLVGAWLEHHGVPSSSASFTHGGSWLTLSNVPVVQADALISASYRLYRHTETNETIIRTIGYSLPTALHEHVQTVVPTSHFGSAKLQERTPQLMQNAPRLRRVNQKSRNASSPCSHTMTPTCLRRLYKTEEYTPRVPKKNTIGVVEYFGISASQADLKKFMTLYRPDAVDSNFTVVPVKGGINNEGKPTAEGAINTQYTESIAYPTSETYYTTGGSSPPYIADSATTKDTNEPYLDWLEFMLNQKTIPQTIVTPYGDDEQTVPPDYAKSVCNLFAQLGARGVSLLFPTGDYGVGGVAGSCLSNDGANRREFLPVFPASCPYVTAVGGTTGVPEVALTASGGGFSNYFERPDYQHSAVSAYLKKIGTTNSGLYNSSGRAYPDVSAQAANFPIVVNGVVGHNSGTSCSASALTGIISLLNDYLISEGKPPRGFLNPWLYSNGLGGLNDITSGSNPRCGTKGFSAAPGWDPVTGLGTPDFVRLQALL